MLLVAGLQHHGEQAEVDVGLSAFPGVVDADDRYLWLGTNGRLSCSGQ